MAGKKGREVRRGHIDISHLQYKLRSCTYLSTSLYTNLIYRARSYRNIKRATLLPFRPGIFITNKNSLIDHTNKRNESKMKCLSTFLYFTIRSVSIQALLRFIL
jgi:hypothetical protein